MTAADDAAQAVAAYAAAAGVHVGVKSTRADFVELACRARGCDGVLRVRVGDAAPAHPLCVRCDAELRRVDMRWGEKRKCLCGRKTPAREPACAWCGRAAPSIANHEYAKSNRSEGGSHDGPT